MPKQRQQDDDRNGNTQQPKQHASTKSHVDLRPLHRGIPIFNALSGGEFPRGTTFSTDVEPCGDICYCHGARCSRGDRGVMNDHTLPETEDISNEASSISSETDPNKLPDMNSSPAGSANLPRSYLLRRWRSAAGFWGKNGNRSAWPLSGAVFLIVVLNLAGLYAMNVWNRGDLRCPRQAQRATRPRARSDLFSAPRRQRVPRGHADLCADDGSAPVASVAERSSDRPLAGERALLPAQPRERRSSKSRVPHRR